MIIQGSNSPIMLEFENDKSEITDFSAALFRGQSGGELKQWQMDDIEISGNLIFLPLTQEETMGLPAGQLILEIKWVDEKNVCFAKLVLMAVQKRNDKTVFTLGGQDGN